MTEDELIEQVARAIHASRWAPGLLAWEATGPYYRSMYLDDARAALAKLRELGMLREEGFRCPECGPGFVPVDEDGCCATYGADATEHLVERTWPEESHADS